VRLAVRRALGRSDLRPRVERVADWITAHDARSRAAVEIEAWASSPETP
jgi:hypothetical protein